MLFMPPTELTARTRLVAHSEEKTYLSPLHQSKQMRF